MTLAMAQDDLTGVVCRASTPDMDLMERGPTSETEKVLISPQRWSVRLPKGRRGLVMDTHECKHPYVTLREVMADGSLAQWNTEQAHLAVRPGDRFVGLAGKLIEEITNAEQEVVLTVLRPAVWSIEVEHAGQGLGVELCQTADRYMYVRSVLRDRPVSRFNKANVDTAVKVGDRVLACNDAETADRIMGALQNLKPDAPARLVMERWD